MSEKRELILVLFYKNFVTYDSGKILSYRIIKRGDWQYQLDGQIESLEPLSERLSVGALVEKFCKEFSKSILNDDLCDVTIQTIPEKDVATSYTAMHGTEAYMREPIDGRDMVAGISFFLDYTNRGKFNTHRSIQKVQGEEIRQFQELDLHQ